MVLWSVLLVWFGACLGASAVALWAFATEDHSERDAWDALARRDREAQR